MVGSIMHDVLGFLGTIGMFDVILPFLLIYVIVFALLERTMILGYDTIDKQSVPKKNLNAMFAFASAFFSILSEKVVSVMNSAIGPIMLLLLIIVLFLLLVSSFNKQEDGMYELGKKQKGAIAVVILIIIILITFNSIKTDDGDTWLEASWDYISDNTNTGFVGAIFLLVGMGAFIMWIGKDSSSPNDSGDDD